MKLNLTEVRLYYIMNTTTEFEYAVW